LAAQEALRAASGYSIVVFDAYRPRPVQAYMVSHTLHELAAARGLDADSLTASQRDELMQDVLQFWALPTLDPKTPPPHSTGAAMDVTLSDPNGRIVDMGGEIDEISPRSWPDHYERSDDPSAAAFRQHRRMLRDTLFSQGFRQHPNEWWHYSYGDQLWAWLCEQAGEEPRTARYGAAESD
jgi:D-alanyl-D-alanine dipeptidase